MMHWLMALLSEEDSLLTCSLIHWFVPVYKGKSAEMHHVRWVCCPSYRGQSADILSCTPWANSLLNINTLQQ